MKLQNQICTIEQAKRLQELGAAQFSMLFYVGRTEAEANDNIQNSWGNDWKDYPGYEAYPVKIAAFTVAELGVMLPINIASYRAAFAAGWWADNKYIDHDVNDESAHASTEAEARAALLIQLIEDNIIAIEDINHRLCHA